MTKFQLISINTVSKYIDTLFPGERAQQGILAKGVGDIGDMNLMARIFNYKGDKCEVSCYVFTKQ